MIFTVDAVGFPEGSNIPVSMEQGFLDTELSPERGSHQVRFDPGSASTFSGIVENKQAKFIIPLQNVQGPKYLRLIPRNYLGRQAPVVTPLQTGPPGNVIPGLKGFKLPYDQPFQCP